MRRLSAVALALAAVGCQAFLPGVPLAAPARSCSRRCPPSVNPVNFFLTASGFAFLGT